jgi:hypothetical protein
LKVLIRFVAEHRVKKPRRGIENIEDFPIHLLAGNLRKSLGIVFKKKDVIIEVKLMFVALISPSGILITHETIIIQKAGE